MLLGGRHALFWLRLVAASPDFLIDVREKEEFFCPKEPKQNQQVFEK